MSFKEELETVLSSYAKNVHYKVPHARSKAVEAITALHKRELLTELGKLHRSHGEECDNATDEAIDDRIEALEEGQDNV